MGGSHAPAGRCRFPRLLSQSATDRVAANSGFADSQFWRWEGQGRSVSGALRSPRSRKALSVPLALVVAAGPGRGFPAAPVRPSPPLSHCHRLPCRVSQCLTPDGLDVHLNQPLRGGGVHLNSSDLHWFSFQIKSQPLLGPSSSDADVSGITVREGRPLGPRAAALVGQF